MEIWDIEHSELNVNVNTVTVRGNPSLTLVDIHFLPTGGSVLPAQSQYPKQTLPAGDVLQVLTTNSNSVVTKITYTIESGTEFVP